MAYYTTMQDASDAAVNMASAARGATVNIEAIPKVSKAATLGLKALSVAGNMLLSIGVSMAISALMKGLSNLANAQENAIEKADEFISKFNEQQKSLTETKSTIDSISEDYQKLANGVDNLGRNVSLSGSEYERYNEIVNKIADMFPQMVQGYTDEGNAIIATKGNVDELTKAYEEQKEAAQAAIITGSADVFKGYKAKVDYNATISWEESGLKQMKDIVDEIVATGGDVDKIKDFLNDNTNHVAMKDVFDKAGLSANSEWGLNDNLVDENYISENLTKFQALATTLNAEIATETAKIKPIMQAYLEQSYAYQSLDDDTADVVKQIVSNFDSEFYSQFDNETQMASFIEENVIGKLKGEEGKEIAKSFTELFTNAELSPEQKNNLIKQIQDYFGKDNPISIFLQPQFEENETTQKNIDKAISKAQEKFGKENIRKQLEDYNKDDTIDFTVRPVIDTSKLKEEGWEKVDDGTATVYSSTYYSEDFGLEEGKALVVTPILPNGDILSPEELEEYARKILSGEEVDVDIKMGMFSGDNYKEEADEFANTIHELHEQYFDGKYVDWKKYFNDQSINTQEELNKWNEVTANAKTAEEAMQMWADATSDSVKGVTSSLEDLEKVSDNIGKLSSAYKELNDDGYITIGTINDIQEATGLSGDEWTAYENKLLNAKKGSAEFNQVMSDLTYKIIENQVSVGDLANATDEEVAAIEKKIAATLRENGVTNASAVAHDYVRVARVNEAIATYDGTQASYDSAAALISESLSADQAKVAMNQLEIAKKMVNSSQIKTASDIDEIIALANAAGASIEFLEDLAQAKSELADGFVGPVHSATQKIMDGEYTPTFNKLNPNDYKISAPKYSSKSSGGSKSSSSDKNDALDNYLEQAERRYKIHQDETKYINDLDYALSNLVKTEEERQDVLDKIEQARKDYADNQVKDLEHIIEMTQNLKGENADVLEYYNQIQDIAHNEADRLRSIGYDDNSDEIQEWQNKWWDAQDKKMDFYSKQHDNIISDIEHARDMALAKNPYVDTTSYYKQMQEEYHKLAELYRSINSEKYAKEIQELQQSWWDAQQSIVDWRWENSQNWINQRNAYNDWALFGDSEIKAWERVVNWLNADYPEALDKIREAEQSLYEARKNEFSKATDLTSSYYDSQKT